MIDVVVGDDHGVFVDALSAVLGRRRVVVRSVAHRTADVREAVRRHRPAICLLDRAFPDGDGIELTTVRTHVQAVMTKLGVHSRPEAALATRHGLVPAV
jgi:DNA-binding NarL/FixJ family response regulator